MVPEIFEMALPMTTKQKMLSKMSKKRSTTPQLYIYIYYIYIYLSRHGRCRDKIGEHAGHRDGSE